MRRGKSSVLAFLVLALVVFGAMLATRIPHGPTDEVRATYELAVKEAQDPESRVTALRALGSAYEWQNELKQAEDAYRSALEISRTTWGRSIYLAKTMTDLSRLAWLRLDVEKAGEYSDKAQEILEELSPHSLETATNLIYLAHVARARGDLESAEKYGRQSLAIAEDLAPESLDVAASLIVLTSVYQKSNLFALAQEHARRALEIQRKRDPESLHVSRSLNALGSLAIATGHLPRAEEHLSRALEIAERLAPDTLDVAAVLKTLGILAEARRHSELAEEYGKRSLEILQSRVPDSRHVASSFQQLGLLYLGRRDFDLAEFYYRRQAALESKIAPGRERGSLFHNLGWLAEARGDLDSAENFFRRAMKATGRTDLETAASLNSLARVAGTRHDWESAEELARRALEIRERLAPDSLDEMHSLQVLGQIAMARGSLDLAEIYIERAVEIDRHVVPDTGGGANNLHDLAMVYRKRDQPEMAAELFENAIEALEIMVRRLGSSHNVKAGFRAWHGRYYRHYVELLLEEKQSEKAFAVLERSRAGSFLAMLAERSLMVPANVPEDLEKARQGLAAQYDQIQHQRGALDPEEDRDRFEVLTSRLRELGMKRASINNEIVKVSRSSLKVAALEALRPLDLESTRKILDPGTVMLSYSVGEESTDVFIVTRGQDLRVETLPLGEEQLRNDVGELRGLLAGSRPEWPYLRDLQELSRRLYSTLVEPVADRAGEGERILIVPDGPLHVLPFGALIREAAGDGGSQGWQYLIEWKPLHTVLSATVYAELKRSRPRVREAEPDTPILIAFGDPYYSPAAGADGIADAAVRSAALRGFDFRPLPATRREVERIAGFFRAGARAYLGPEATEERAKAIERAARYLHFAAHGHLDDRLPLDSGLALAIPEELRPGRDNGLLQAWEIIEQMRLDCELAVLSACASGLGKELGGDGLIGLTRAFQLAGARSVLASLWNVADVTTAELMVRFYRHLNDGMSKDEALQAAQIELIRAPIRLPDDRGRLVEVDARVPYYWAAFQLYGDWR